MRDFSITRMLPPPGVFGAPPPKGLVMKLYPRAAAAIGMLGVSAAAVLISSMPASAGPDAATPLAATRHLAEMPPGLSAAEMPADAADTSVDTTVFHPPSVEDQFRALSVRADALGFGLGPSDPDQTTLCKHYQGVARSEGPGDPYLFVTHSRNRASCLADNDYAGELLMVKMATRGNDGERMRSNRLQKGESVVNTAPPLGNLFMPGDKVTELVTSTVWTVTFPTASPGGPATTTPVVCSWSGTSSWFPSRARSTTTAPTA